jgi:hypothetical protein
VLRLNDLARRKCPHGLAERDLGPVIAEVQNPSSHRGIGRQIVNADQILTLGNGGNLSIPDVEILGLGDAGRSRFEPHLTVDHDMFPCIRSMRGGGTPDILYTIKNYFANHFLTQ